MQHVLWDYRRRVGSLDVISISVIVILGPGIVKIAGDWRKLVG